MDVKKILKTENGSVEFSGTLTDEEHTFVLAVGLNTLMEAGALPYTQDDDDFGVPEGSAVN